ncbi:MAG: hypothetical protein Q8K89_08175 [Actinomycetota bacterium]|nr:hypothetical protein [Actinomycetota bacterium]
MKALATFEECGYTIGRLYCLRTLIDIDLVDAPHSALQQALEILGCREGRELPRESSYLTAAAARAALACQNHSLSARLASSTLNAAEHLSCALLLVESHLLLAQVRSMTPLDDFWRDHILEACRIADTSGLAIELESARACLSDPNHLSRLCGYRSGSVVRPQLRLPTTNLLLSE